MENVNDRKLSFGQRNWFLLCILSAILSPLLIHFVQVVTMKKAYQQSIDIRHSDTSNNIASPPTTDTTQKKTTDTAK